VKTSFEADASILMRKSPRQTLGESSKIASVSSRSGKRRLSCDAATRILSKSSFDTALLSGSYFALSTRSSTHHFSSDSGFTMLSTMSASRTRESEGNEREKRASPSGYLEARISVSNPVWMS